MNYDNWLEKIPAYKDGDLPPSEAHRIANLLEEDEEFALEAMREELIVEVLSGPSFKPLPVELVRKSVVAAAGESIKEKWVSLETILIALGVGLFCAAIAELLAPKLPDFLALDGTLTHMTTLLAENALGVIGGIWLGTTVILIAGVYLIFKVIRSS